MTPFIRLLCREQTFLVIVTAIPALSLLAALIGRRGMRRWIPPVVGATVLSLYFAALAGFSRGKMAALGETLTMWVFLFLVFVVPIAAVLVGALSHYSVRLRERLQRTVSAGRGAAAVAGYIGFIGAVAWLSGFTNWGNLAYRAACMNNIRQIGIATLQYAHDHDGRNPDSFGVLLKEGYLTTDSVFICPSGSRELPWTFPTDFKAARLEDLNTVGDWGDYVLVKGLDKRRDSELILIYEKDGAHQGEGRNVFFADGHVQWHSEERFREMMAKQRVHSLPSERPKE